MKKAIDIPAITLNPATASGKNATNREVLPLFDVPEPGDNDVLSGRGVTTNKHAGNVNFRSLVALNKELYVTSTKKQKMAISRSIVEAVRSMNPPGRFLDKNPTTGLWSDIGDRKAIEKTSQALRDGAATLRKQLSEDLGDPDFLSAVFENNNSAAAAADSKGRSDGSACSGTTSSSESKKQPRCKPLARPMKSTMAKKGHRRAKSVPTETTAAKKGLKKARLDQVVPHIPEPPAKKKPAAVVSAAAVKQPRTTHARSNSLGAVPPKRSPRIASAGGTSTTAHQQQSQQPPNAPVAPAAPPRPEYSAYAVRENEEFLEQVDPWTIGHSRNSSVSTSSSGPFAFPPFFPMSPIGRPSPARNQQHIFSCFQEPKPTGSRPPMSPMHRSWSPRDFQDGNSSPLNWRDRESIGGNTCFSEGDIDIPSLDRTFDRTFDRTIDRFSLEEEDMRMRPILPPSAPSEPAAGEPMGDGSEKVPSSRSTTPNDSKNAMDIGGVVMDLNYSPTECDFGKTDDDLMDDVIMTDSDQAGRPLSPLPFMRDENDVALLENLPDLLQMPIPETSPTTK